MEHCEKHNLDYGVDEREVFGVIIKTDTCPECDREKEENAKHN